MTALPSFQVQFRRALDRAWHHQSWEPRFAAGFSRMSARTALALIAVASCARPALDDGGQRAPAAPTPAGPPSAAMRDVLPSGPGAAPTPIGGGPLGPRSLPATDAGPPDPARPPGEGRFPTSDGGTAFTDAQLGAAADECRRCASERCAAQVRECERNPECEKAVACARERCPKSDSCATECVFGAAGYTALAVFACLTTRCPTECVAL